jgi:hypothetical protein
MQLSFGGQREKEDRARLSGRLNDYQLFDY